MARTLSVCALLLVVAYPVQGDETGKPTVTVIRMTVSPMDMPMPAMKYHLLPQLTEMNPGNPIMAYLKCFMEQQNFFHSKDAISNREKWQALPLKDLPVKELRSYGGIALRQADYAARLDQPDWQILLKMKKDGFGLLLPEVQQLRALAVALKVRFRGEVADHRFGDGVRTAKTMFALARHMGKHPTLISNLVGIAISFVAIDPLQEMIQQPGCPNLFWAMTNLPSPLVNLRKGVQGERLASDSELALLDASAPMTTAQLTRLEKHLKLIFSYLEKTTGEHPLTRLRTLVKNKSHVQAARQRLVSSGMAKDLVQRFPALQVVFLDEKREYEIQLDESMKGFFLPYWKARALKLEVTGKVKQQTVFSEFIPACWNVRRAQIRLEQRLALLAHVEALRWYAAKNKGKLPAKLADINLPLPVDPVTGKAFNYKKEGDKAILQGTPPTGQEKNPTFNLRFEVTIKA